MESILYYLRATTPIEALAGHKHSAADATGFRCLAEEPRMLYLITNRHVCVSERGSHYPERLRV